jgi:AcrR family transcriptional regulator
MGTPAPAHRRTGPSGVVGAPASGGTRQLILDTAQRLFDEQGYDATSLRQIADAVGMTKAAVYYHYPAKEHLLLELTRPLLDAMSELVAHLRHRSADGRHDAAAALAAYLDLFVEHHRVMRLLALDPATLNHPDVGQRGRTLAEAIQQQMSGAEASIERQVRTACAMGVVHAVGTLTPETARAHRQVVLDAAVAALGE